MNSGGLGNAWKWQRDISSALEAYRSWGRANNMTSRFYGRQLWERTPISWLPSLSGGYQFVLPHPQRRFQSFCVGTPRSGTHSLADMFAPAYRSVHEPDFVRINTLIAQWLAGQISDRSMLNTLKVRDRVLGLELESAHLMHYVTPLLAQLFPQAKFILTIRDPFTWLRSELNRTSLTQCDFWKMLHPYRYGRYGFDFTPEDWALKQQSGLYPLASYLAYWRDHNQQVIDAVPADRLLILKTQDISRRLAELADFLGISSHSIDVAKTHSGKTEQKNVDVFELVGADYVEKQVFRHCQPLMEQYFPEITCLADAVSATSLPASSKAA